MPADRWRPAYVGIGSNLDDPCRQVHRAGEALAGLQGCSNIVISPLYRSAPVGPQDQDDYINAIAAMLTTLDAPALLSALLAIETRHGRVRDGVRWGARVIDLDLLMLSDVTIQSARLTLPHPRLSERRFVLQPWADLCPTLSVPGRGPLSAMLANVAEQRVVPVADASC